MPTPRRALLWAPTLAILTAALLALAWARRLEGFQQARAALLAGDAAMAERLLLGLPGGARLRADSAGVLALARLASGAATAPEPPAGPLAVDPVALAWAAFARGDFEPSWRLARLALDRGRPAAALAAAALLELGRDREARAVWAGGPVAVPRGALARRVAAALADRDDTPLGSRLNDRRGRPLGRLDAEGTLTLSAGVEAQLVPPTLAAALAAALAAEQGTLPAGLRLSLDLELSALARDALGNRRGSIVLLDARSGALLAAVSDRRSLAAGGTPAFEQRREPASIAKLITAAAVLRAGLDPDALLAGMRCRGHRSYDGTRLYCPHIAGPLRNLDRAMAISCNVAFADLALAVGRQRLLDELRRFGFDAGRLGPFPSGRILAPAGDRRQLADLAIGLEASDITPLHAALLAAAVANDGTMPTPTLVIGADGRLGFHPRPQPPAPGRRVLAPRLVSPLRRAMAAVTAPGGTAYGIVPRDFPVAMKTGTASDPRHGFHVNYIGFGPLPSAGIAFCVRITHQRTSRRVGRAAREVTHRLLAGLARARRRHGALVAGVQEGGAHRVDAPKRSTDNKGSETISDGVRRAR